MTQFCQEHLSLFLFKAEWCSYCKYFEPIFDEVGQMLVQRKLAHIFKFEQQNSKHRKIISEFKIKGYPTTILYKNAIDTYLVYTGARSKDALFDFVQKHYANPNSTQIPGFKTQVYQINHTNT